MRCPAITPGLAFELVVLRFTGSARRSPVYMQAALHAQELPGFVALQRLLPRLVAAERDGRLRSDVTIVPHANPIGLAQALLHENSGRFDFNSRSISTGSFPCPDSRRGMRLQPARPNA